MSRKRKGLSHGASCEHDVSGARVGGAFPPSISSPPLGASESASVGEKSSDSEVFKRIADVLACSLPHTACSMERSVLVIEFAFLQGTRFLPNSMCSRLFEDGGLLGRAQAERSGLPSRSEKSPQSRRGSSRRRASSEADRPESLQPRRDGRFHEIPFLPLERDRDAACQDGRRVERAQCDVRATHLRHGADAGLRRQRVAQQRLEQGIACQQH